jgi:hypothetical protein
MDQENADEVQASPPTWFSILEELLDLADAHVHSRNLKVRPQANTMQPVVSCDKNHDSDSEGVDSEDPS